MHIILASALLAVAALPAHADVSETPIPDGPPMAIEEILADIPAAEPAAPQAPLPAEIIPAQAESATAIPATDTATESVTEATPKAAPAPQQATESAAGTPAPVAESANAATVATPETATPAPAETAPQAAADGAAAAASAESLGYTQPVPTPSGAMPESTTWQPPVATGIDLGGNPRS